jgi:hypothetical protein
MHSSTKRLYRVSMFPAIASFASGTTRMNHRQKPKMSLIPVKSRYRLSNALDQYSGCTWDILSSHWVYRNILRWNIATILSYTWPTLGIHSAGCTCMYLAKTWPILGIYSSGYTCIHPAQTWPILGIYSAGYTCLHPAQTWPILGIYSAGYTCIHPA